MKNSQNSKSVPGHNNDVIYRDASLGCIGMYVFWTGLLSSLSVKLGRLRGLAVACCTTDHPCSNPVGISEGCFVFHFVSLHLEVARLI